MEDSTRHPRPAGAALVHAFRRCLDRGARPPTTLFLQILSCVSCGHADGRPRSRRMRRNARTSAEWAAGAVYWVRKNLRIGLL